MNKYQEVLNVLGMIILDSSSNGYDSPKNLKDFYPKEIETLQELINKVKIVKPIKVHKETQGENKMVFNAWYCGACNENVGFERKDKILSSKDDKDEWCNGCHALIDWSDEDENC